MIMLYARRVANPKRKRKTYEDLRSMTWFYTLGVFHTSKGVLPIYASIPRELSHTPSVGQLGPPVPSE